jgi:hypothetical protein
LSGFDVISYFGFFNKTVVYETSPTQSVDVHQTRISGRCLYQDAVFRPYVCMYETGPEQPSVPCSCAPQKACASDSDAAGRVRRAAISSSVSTGISVISAYLSRNRFARVLVYWLRRCAHTILCKIAQHRSASSMFSTWCSRHGRYSILNLLNSTPKTLSTCFRPPSCSPQYSFSAAVVGLEVEDMRKRRHG